MPQKTGQLDLGVINTPTPGGRIDTVIQTPLIAQGTPSPNAQLTLVSNPAGPANNLTAFKFNSGSFAGIPAGWVLFLDGSLAAGEVPLVIADLWTDASGVPGAKIETGQTLVLPSFPSGTPFPFNLVSYTAALVASTNYWIVARLALGPTSVAKLDYNATGTGQIVTSTNGGTSWSAHAGTGQFNVYGTTPSGGQYISTISATVLAASTTFATALYAQSTSGRAIDVNSQFNDAIRGSSSDGLAAGINAVNSGGGPAGRFDSGGIGPQLHLVPVSFVGAPTTGPWHKGDAIMDSNTDIFVCQVGGTPGVWRKVTLV